MSGAIKTADTLIAIIPSSAVAGLQRLRLLFVSQTRLASDVTRTGTASESRTQLTLVNPAYVVMQQQQI